MNPETLILQIARGTIQTEAHTLLDLLPQIDQDFCLCAKKLFYTTGRIVVTGVGKSAIIAQKMVATLNSTGSPAIFMHAADAVHGDLGMIQPDDAVICISKSGETSEIKVLLPILKNLGNLLIGMTSNLQSFLGKYADFVLYTPVKKEADPNNLAPTASTSAQMAMGDALAMSLLALRGFSPRSFANFHPGGTLGKQLYLRVKDVYHLNEKPLVSVKDSIKKVIMEISSKRLGATVVSHPSGKIAGIITDGDLRRMLEKTHNFDTLSAADIMSKNPKTIDENDLAAKALEIMRTSQITQLVVLSQQSYTGIIHLHDILREGLI